MAKEGRDWLGSFIGIAVFLLGIALLGLTFQMAYKMFGVPPSQALEIKPGTPISLDKTGTSFAGVLIHILLLIVMALMGSWIANRGIAFYSSSRAHHHPHPAEPK